MVVSNSFRRCVQRNVGLAAGTRELDDRHQGWTENPPANEGTDAKISNHYCLRVLRHTGNVKPKGYGYSTRFADVLLLP